MTFFAKTAHPFLIILFLFLFFPYRFSSAAPGARDIRIGIAVHDNFKTSKDWKQKFEKRLAYASQIFEREFKIRFIPAVYWDWPAGATQDSFYLLEDLLGRYPLTDVDIVLGLIRLTDLKGITDLTDLDVLGRTSPFSGYMVIRYPNEPLYRIQEETVLTHELGHMFGAIHTADPGSIMSPVVQKQIPDVFDKVNRGIVGLTRGMDFRNGTHAMDPATVQQLLNSYRLLMSFAQPCEFYEALGDFYLRLGKSDDAVRALKAARALNDDNPRIHYELGSIYWETGQDDDAISELTKAAAQFHLPSQKTYKALSLNLLGGVYFRRNNVNSAYDSWSTASALEPGNPQIEMNLAAVQMVRGQIEDAAKRFQIALKADPENPSILSNLGSAYFRMADYGQAVDYLNKALTAINKQGGVTDGGTRAYEIHERIASAYMAMKQPGAAIEHYSKACETNPDVNCHMKVAKMYYDQAAWPACIKELESIYAVKKTDPDFYGMLGVAYSKKGEPDKAAGVFESGIQNISDKKARSNLRKNLGNLYLQAQRFDLAEKQFNFAIGDDWNNSQAHLGLAMTALANKNVDQARTSLKNVLLIDPKNPDAADMLRRIDGH